MKKLFFIIAFATLHEAVTAQQPFATAGATWHYYYSAQNGFSFGFHKTYYSGDTVLNGIQCKILETVGYYYLAPDSLISVYYPPLIYLYQDGDTVFRFINGQFFVWFNFGAMPGDQWVVDDTQGPSTCDPLSTLKVTARTTQILNGQTLRRLTVDTVGQSPYGYHGDIVERIGPFGVTSFLPFEQNCDSNPFFEFPDRSFACYEDSAFGLYNVTPYPCGYWLYTGIEAPEKYPLEITPNPSSGHIKIRTGSEAGRGVLTIYNLLGEVVFESPFDGHQLEVVLPVETGVYFAEVKGKNKHKVQKIIVRK